MVAFRDISYYGWQDIYYVDVEHSSSDSPYPITGSNIYRIKIDSSGTLYMCGFYSVPGLDDCWFVERSKDGGYNWELVDFVNTANARDRARGLCIDSNDVIYVCGQEEDSNGDRNWIVRRSTTGNSGTFEYVDFINRTPDKPDYAYDVAVDSNNAVYVVGSEVVGVLNHIVVRKSDTGESGSFYYVSDGNSDQYSITGIGYGIYIDPNDYIYIMCDNYLGAKGNEWLVARSTTGLSDSFGLVDRMAS